MDAPMPDPQQAAVLAFLRQLPRSANTLEEQDVPWLVSQLGLPIFEFLSTKQASAIGRALGTSALLTASELVPRLAVTICLHWERDDLRPADVDLRDRDVTVWLQTLAEVERS